MIHLKSGVSLLVRRGLAARLQPSMSLQTLARTKPNTTSLIPTKQNKPSFRSIQLTLKRATNGTAEQTSSVRSTITTDAKRLVVFIGRGVAITWRITISVVGWLVPLYILYCWLSYQYHRKNHPITGRTHYSNLGHHINRWRLANESKIWKENEMLQEDEAEWKRVDEVVVKLVLSNKHFYDDFSSFDWNVNIICSDTEENAFTLPNGHIYITSMFLKTLDTDDKLASVLAHEMSHVYLQHLEEKASLAKFIAQCFINSTVYLWVLGDKYTSVQEAMMRMLGVESLGKLPYNLQLELEADEFGSDLVARAAFDPREGAALLLLREAKENYGTGKIYSEYYHVHPHVARRTEFIGNHCYDLQMKYGSGCCHSNDSKEDPIQQAAETLRNMKSSRDIRV